uniref:BTB domain-containing protein n=1 Tax=Panagrolaimus sp. ES5 TaxID=591445 RepID=A0AC34G892_9BILA
MTELSQSSSSSVKLYWPIRQTWTITEESLLRMIDHIDGGENNATAELRSELKAVEAVPNLKYQIHPQYRNAISGKRAFFLFLHLYTTKPVSRIHAKFTFSIKSENYLTQFNNVFDEDQNGWGDEICHVKEFFDSRRNFIVDGKFTVEMKGLLIFDDEEMQKVVQLQASPLVQALWEREDKDFKIIVENEGTVLVHKYVLCARSSFFESMFRAGREEAKTDTLKIVDFNLKTIEKAIEFFYDQNIFASLNIDDGFELLRFADKYNIADLQDKLELHFTYLLSPSTVCQLANGSISSNSIKFRQICFDFMMICSKQNIPVENLDILDKKFAAELFQATFAPLSE